MKFLYIKRRFQIEVVLRSVSLEAMQWISLCGNNETSYQQGAIFDRENGSATYQLLYVNMKRSRLSLAWDLLFKLKITEFIVNPAPWPGQGYYSFEIFFSFYFYLVFQFAFFQFSFS